MGSHKGTPEPKSNRNIPAHPFFFLWHQRENLCSEASPFTCLPKILLPLPCSWEGSAAPTPSRFGAVSPAHTGSCSRGEFPVSGSGAGCGFPAPSTLWHISTCWPENPRVGEAESHGRGAWGGDPTGMEPWTPILYPQCRFPGLWEWDLGSHWDGNGIPVS